MFKHLKDLMFRQSSRRLSATMRHTRRANLVLLLKKHANGVDDLTRQGLS